MVFSRKTHLLKLCNVTFHRDMQWGQHISWKLVLHKVALFTVVLCILRHCSGTSMWTKKLLLIQKVPLPFSCYLIPHGHKWSKNVWVLKQRNGMRLLGRLFSDSWVGKLVGSVCFFAALYRWGSVVCSFFLGPVPPPNPDLAVRYRYALPWLLRPALGQELTCGP